MLRYKAQAQLWWRSASSWLHAASAQCTVHWCRQRFWNGLPGHESNSVPRCSWTPRMTDTQGRPWSASFGGRSRPRGSPGWELSSAPQTVKWKKENRKEEKARWPRKGTEWGRKKKIIATTYCYQVFPVYSQCTVNVIIILTTKQLEQRLKRLCKLTSANNLWFSAWRTCAFFFAEAKGDWVMWVGTGCWALSGDTYFARCWEDDLEAEQEGWGLSSSSSSSRTMILSAIEAGATAIQNVGNSAFGKHKK